VTVEAVGSSETSVNYETAQRQILEDRDLQSPPLWEPQIYQLRIIPKFKASTPPSRYHIMTLKGGNRVRHEEWNQVQEWLGRDGEKL
jgi:hypothetical protein